MALEDTLKYKLDEREKKKENPVEVEDYSSEAINR